MGGMVMTGDKWSSERNSIATVSTTDLTCPGVGWHLGCHGV